MFCGSSVFDNTPCPAGSVPACWVSHHAPCRHLASSWLGPSRRPHQQTNRTIHPATAQSNQQRCSQHRRLEDFLKLTARPHLLFTGWKVTFLTYYSSFLFHYLMRCVHGWNLCCCSGEFHTNTPPYPPDHTNTFLWGQSSSSRAKGRCVRGQKKSSKLFNNVLLLFFIHLFKSQTNSNCSSTHVFGLCSIVVQLRGISHSYHLLWLLPFSQVSFYSW